MAVALRGNLQDFGIAEVFQLIGQQRKTGTLDVSHDGQTMRLAFDEGRVVWGRPARDGDDDVLGERLVRCGLLTQERLDTLRVESRASARSIGAVAVASGDVSASALEQIEEIVTADTIFTVLRWPDGSFDFSAKHVSHDRPQDKLLAAEQILMDGLRMVDEWQTFAELVPDGDTVFERSGPMIDYKRDLSGESRRRLPTVERVYSLIDGRLTAQRIIDLARLGLFDATRALAELRHHGVIAPVARQSRAFRRRSGGSGRPILQMALPGLAAGVAIALLSGVVHGIGAAAPEGREPGVFPIVRSPLAGAQDAFATRRLRNALEAERLREGAWPANLSHVDPGGLAGDTLTPAHAGAYYYARREDGVLLLAPSRVQDGRSLDQP